MKLVKFFLLTANVPPCLPRQVKNCVWPAMGMNFIYFPGCIESDLVIVCSFVLVVFSCMRSILIYQ